MNEEIEQLKKDPLEFMEKSYNLKLYPYQRAMVKYIMEHPDTKITFNNYRRRRNFWAFHIFLIIDEMYKKFKKEGITKDNTEFL